MDFANVDLSQLDNIDDVQKALVWLANQEIRVKTELDQLLDRNVQLESQFIDLQRQMPKLDDARRESRNLATTASRTSELAERVSRKVKILDLAKNRVHEAMGRVDDVLDLRSCVEGVQTAMEREDYEQAAAHVHRYLALDENVLKETAVDAAEGSGIGGAFALLRDAEKQLKYIVAEKFDLAVGEEDGASIERFFKIFPLLNLQYEGMEKFSSYLRTKISSSAKAHLRNAENVQGDRAGVVYADVLTYLFEDIARLVESRQPLVETYYGPGKMLPLVKSLQVECDVQVSAIVTQFREERHLDRKLQEVRLAYSGRITTAAKIQPKELDILLSEMTMCSARSELYLRFLRRRIAADLDVLAQEETLKDTAAVLEKMIQESQLSVTMQQLSGEYISVEDYFMRESFLKAVHLDTSAELESGSYTSSIVDDVFFIIQKSVRRAVSSSSVDCVCAMLNHANSLLVHDYKEVLEERLQGGFPSKGIDFSGVLQGKLQTSSSDVKASRLAFLVTLNNVESSTSNIRKLKQDLEVDCSALLAQVGEQAKAKVGSCLSDLASAASAFKDLLTWGISQLCLSAVAPRLKPMIDAFLSVSHNINDEQFGNYEISDPFVQQFIAGLQSLLDTFKGDLSPSNYDALASLITDELASHLERIVFKSSFNQLGGLQFDKELRSLVAYLSSVTQWTVRDRFARLTQLATLLNLERVSEVLDYWGPNAGLLTWRLTPSEVRKVLSLRVDFRKEDIDRLKL
ncbi:conserved oligomeric Golgi complex subunit 4-like [Oscarella lobularis]|uniref:conserved oligomeric Golgi complex subunit 4-like n=1 Tax=Oscarella lobularis TaxID=121494 RepID=UPI0033140494